MPPVMVENRSENPDDLKLLEEYRKKMTVKLQHETEADRLALRSSYKAQVSVGGSPMSVRNNGSPLYQNQLNESINRQSKGKQPDSCEASPSSNKVPPLLMPQTTDQKSPSSGNMTPSVKSSRIDGTSPRTSPPSNTHLHHWFPEAGKHVPYTKVVKAQKMEINCNTVCLSGSPNRQVPSARSPEGWEYIDFTMPEEALHLHQPNLEGLKEQLFQQCGRHHVSFQWCYTCEDVAQHRNWAWNLLQAVMRAFPELDYLHSLPTEVPLFHRSELLPFNTHKAPSMDCKEMYLLFQPRGGHLHTLKATTGEAAVSALQKVLDELPKCNMAITLLNGRQLPLSGKIRRTCNPFVNLEVNGQKLISKYTSNTRNPDFALQLFTFAVEDPSSSVLQLTLMHHSKKGNHKTLGKASLPLNSLKIGEVNRISMELQDCPAGSEINFVIQAEGEPFVEGLVGQKNVMRFDQQGRSTVISSRVDGKHTPRTMAQNEFQNEVAISSIPTQGTAAQLDFPASDSSDEEGDKK